MRRNRHNNILPNSLAVFSPKDSSKTLTKYSNLTEFK